MRDSLLENLKNAMKAIDDEIRSNMNSSTWPKYCSFLPKTPRVQVDEKLEEWDEWHKYCHDRAVFPIEIPNQDFNKTRLNSDMIKEKINNPFLNPLRNQEGCIIDKSKITSVIGMSFLKYLDGNNYLVDHLGLTKGIDSYQIYLALYYKK